MEQLAPGHTACAAILCWTNSLMVVGGPSVASRRGLGSSRAPPSVVGEKKSRIAAKPASQVSGCFTGGIPKWSVLGNQFVNVALARKASGGTRLTGHGVPVMPTHLPDGDPTSWAGPQLPAWRVKAPFLTWGLQGTLSCSVSGPGAKLRTRWLLIYFSSCWMARCLPREPPFFLKRFY